MHAFSDITKSDGPPMEFLRLPEPLASSCAQADACMILDLFKYPEETNDKVDAIHDKPDTDEAD